LFQLKIAGLFNCNVSYPHTTAADTMHYGGKLFIIFVKNNFFKKFQTQRSANFQHLSTLLFFLEKIWGVLADFFAPSLPVDS
jgi:hypothetical protein